MNEHRPRAPRRSSSTTTGSIDAFARSCSTRTSAIGTPAISAGPWRGNWTCTTANPTSEGRCSSPAGGSHNATSASAARCSNDSHARPRPGRIASVSLVITASNRAPITSGNWPWTCNIPRSCVHHIRTDRAANRLRLSTAVGFTTLRACRASSSGAIPAARAAHSPSLASSASFTVDRSCSSDKAPSNATRPISGNDSNARAVSTFSRTTRADSPSDPTDRST